jgi:hypothetical protein
MPNMDVKYDLAVIYRTATRFRLMILENGGWGQEEKEEEKEKEKEKEKEQQQQQEVQTTE